MFSWKPNRCQPVLPGRLSALSLCAFALVTAGITPPTHAAPPPTVAVTMQFKPVQPGIDFETPKPGELDKCRVEPAPANSGWVVYGAGGQVLRKFLDTDKDGTVDTRKFYNLGLEVYRDVDTNKNNKIDQCRWVNTGGTRWGVDRNEDGTIDQWLVISADEAAREAVSGVASNNPARIAAVMMSPEDMKTVGLSPTVAAKIKESTSNIANRVRSILSTDKTINRTSTWMRFDPQGESMVPKDEGRASTDLTLLGNPMAIVETGGKTAIIQIGEMVRINNVWKLTTVPRPIGADKTVTTTGILMQPAESNPGQGGMAYSKAVQGLLEQLQQVDKSTPNQGSTPAQRKAYAQARADILTRIIAESKEQDERDQWTRQLADGLALAVQGGGFPDGLDQLKKLEANIYRADKSSTLLPYVTFRRVSAEYNLRLNTSNNDKRQEAQKWYAGQLEGFWKQYPRAEDTPDVLFQLALGNEYVNNLDEAKKWYGQLARQFPKLDQGKKGAGAMRRLSMEGKPLQMSGTAIEGGQLSLSQYKGRVTLVHYWGTWCGPCTDDMPLLVALHEAYKADGFEIVGINMDPKGSESKIAAYKKKYRMAWKSLSEPGQLDGPLARDFGIVSAPTMFLIGKDGNVISRSASITDLKKDLPTLLK